MTASRETIAFDAGFQYAVTTAHKMASRMIALAGRDMGDPAVAEMEMEGLLDALRIRHGLNDDGRLVLSFGSADDPLHKYTEGEPLARLVVLLVAAVTYRALGIVTRQTANTLQQSVDAQLGRFRATLAERGDPR